MGSLRVKSRHRLLCGDSTKAEDVEQLMENELMNLAVTSPPYASQRKYDESSGFKPIQPKKYVSWFFPVQRAVQRHLHKSGSWILNIKEASSDGCKQSYVKRLVLQHIDEWGWKWIDEYCWPRPALPVNPNTSRRFKNGWESVYHFATDIRYKFYPDKVSHKSDRCFKYVDQKAAGKMIGGAQGVGNSIMSTVNHFTGMAYPSNVLPNMGGARVVGHSAAFPVGIPEFFILALTDEMDRVYDPFLGSGTTLIAAENLGRKCYSMEISPGYCDVIVERWESLTGEKAVRP